MVGCGAALAVCLQVAKIVLACAHAALNVGLAQSHTRRACGVCFSHSHGSLHMRSTWPHTWLYRACFSRGWSHYVPAIHFLNHAQNALAELEDAGDVEARDAAAAAHPRLRELSARYGEVRGVTGVWYFHGIFI